MPHSLQVAVRLFDVWVKALKPNAITNGAAPAEPAAAMISVEMKPVAARMRYSTLRVISREGKFLPAIFT